MEVNALIKAFCKKQLKSNRTDNKWPKSSKCKLSGTQELRENGDKFWMNLRCFPVEKPMNKPLNLKHWVPQFNYVSERNQKVLQRVVLPHYISCNRNCLDLKPTVSVQQSTSQHIFKAVIFSLAGDPPAILSHFTASTNLAPLVSLAAFCLTFLELCFLPLPDSPGVCASLLLSLFPGVFLVPLTLP